METKEITLDDIMPEKPEFYLSITKKTYQLRLPNLDDRIWMQRKFGDGLSDIVRRLDWVKLSEVIYRLMMDRSDFMAQAVNEIDDEGVKREAYLTGPEVFRIAIQSPEEQEGVLAAFNSAFANSSPRIKKSIEDEVKKNILQRTGERSLTSSNPNTDGVTNT